MATKKPAKKTAPSRRGVRTPGSMADQINQLDVGQCVAVAERFNVGSHAHAADVISDSMTKMRSTMGAYVARITEELDMREFKIESGTYLSNDKTGIIAAVTVTRTD